MHYKSYSHFSSKKCQHICVSLDVNFNESLTNDIVSFEQLGPDVCSLLKFNRSRLKINFLLSFQVESLQANADIATEQLTTMKARLEKFKDVNEDENENNMKMVESDQEKSVESDSEGENWLILLLLNTTCTVLANSVDPDQLASEEANWSGSALFVIKREFLSKTQIK